MFAHKITIFRVFGFSISVDASWLFLLVLVTWSLAQGALPFEFPGFSVATYWWMGFGGAVGLFVSIVLHELGHALVARHFGIPIKDITLFIFGGVAEMEDEPPNARSEFLMAIAGPATSVLLAAGLYGIYRLDLSALGPGAGPSPGIAVAGYLAWLNGLLALFNLLPAFPLDGGRVLRAALWAWRENLRWATRIASEIGAFFGVLLIVLGVVSFISGNLIGGVWWLMIGFFMRSASRMSYKQVLMRKALEGESLRRFMRAQPISVSPDLPIAELVENYVYRFHHKMFPVTAGDDKLLGCVSTRDIKTIAREQWDHVRVSQAMTACTDANCIGPDEDPMKVLSLMNRTGASRLIVAEGNKLVGIVALKDLLRFLSVKMDLENGHPHGRVESPGQVAVQTAVPEKVPPLWNLRTDADRGKPSGQDAFLDADEMEGDAEEEIDIPYERPKTHV